MPYPFKILNALVASLHVSIRQAGDAATIDYRDSRIDLALKDLDQIREALLHEKDQPL
jgi:hypothetical protein